jgi:hypothetical protein
VLAARHRRIRLGQWAVAAHPLVKQTGTAAKIFGQFAAAHRALGDWR